MIELKKHIVPGYCAAKFCRNKTTCTLCSTCRSKQTRIKDPVRYAYITLVNNAKRRNVICTITLNQFRDWCTKVTYIGFSGRKSESFTIDRKYNDIGYHIDNIQVMKKGQNVKKYFSYDYRSKQVMITTDKILEPAEDLPF